MSFLSAVPTALSIGSSIAGMVGANSQPSDPYAGMGGSPGAYNTIRSAGVNTPFYRLNFANGGANLTGGDAQANDALSQALAQFSGYTLGDAATPFPSDEPWRLAGDYQRTTAPLLDQLQSALGGLGSATNSFSTDRTNLLAQLVARLQTAFGNLSPALTGALTNYTGATGGALTNYTDATSQGLSGYSDAISRALADYTGASSAALTAGQTGVGQGLAVGAGGLTNALSNYHALMNSGYFAPLLQAQALQRANLSSLQADQARRGLAGSSLAAGAVSNTTNQNALSLGQLAQILAGANYGVESGNASALADLLGKGGQALYTMGSGTAQGQLAAADQTAQGRLTATDQTAQGQLAATDQTAQGQFSAASQTAKDLFSADTGTAGTAYQAGADTANSVLGANQNLFGATGSAVNTGLTTQQNIFNNGLAGVNAWNQRLMNGVTVANNLVNNHLNELGLTTQYAGGITNALNGTVNGARSLAGQYAAGQGAGFANATKDLGTAVGKLPWASWGGGNGNPTGAVGGLAGNNIGSAGDPELGWGAAA